MATWVICAGPREGEGIGNYVRACDASASVVIVPNPCQLRARLRRDLAGSCVIVGRCADYVLRGMPEATNVFVYAEEADKIKRAVEQYGVPENEVKKLMKDTDKARANYYAYHTGRKWGEPVNYNLSIDSGYIEIDDIVDLIIMYTDRKLYK